MSVAAALGLSMIAAYFCTKWVQHNAMLLHLVRQPNARSSHVAPTPHGGGIGIVVTCTLSGIVISTLYAWDIGWAITGLALVVAAVGLWDDIEELAQIFRLCAQVGVCIAYLAILTVPVSTHPGSSQFILLATVAAIGVWWINLFNFMDGIDGIAASQAIFMLFAGIAVTSDPCGLGVFARSPQTLWLLCIGGATSGFLLLNWPPARIFMGDVGSTYLAFLIFALAAAFTLHDPRQIFAWTILAALFVSDATVTLIVRIVTRKRWYQAHRSHAYQRLSRKMGGHRPVTLLVIAVNVFWLFPLAKASMALPSHAVLIAITAYLPIIFGTFLVGAGRDENS